MNVVEGEGFRTPAPNTTARGAAGPAFESLPWRKPRAGYSAVWPIATYGDLNLGQRAPVSVGGPEARGFVCLDEPARLG
jgi:hypothetical protein